MREQHQLLLLFLITLGIGVFSVLLLRFLPAARGFFIRAATGTVPTPAARLLDGATIILVLALPFLLLLIYLIFGREQECVVPEYLSMVPDPTIKPWIVNLLFTGDPLDFDENGYYATLLDLHRRGIIRLSLASPGHVQIRILDDQPLDEYEKRVVKFLRDLSEGDLLDLVILLEDRGATLEGIAWKEEREKFQRTFSLLTSVPEMVPVSQYFENGLKWILPLGVLGILLHAASLLAAGEVAAGTGGAALIEAVIVSGLLAASLFTMWKVQENSLRRGADPLALAAGAGFISLLFLLPYYANPTLFFRMFIAVVFLLVLASAALIAAAGWVGGPVTRFGTALIPLVLAVFLGAYALSGFIRVTPVAAFYVPPALLSFVLVVQVMVAMSFPSTLLGRWRGHWFGERCRWDAFRAFLADFALIRESPPEGITLWGDWLVFGTALGVGDKVIEAVAGLEVDLPEAEIAPVLREEFAPLTWTSPSPRGVFGWGWSGRRS
jgi:hypothetical protein